MLMSIKPNLFKVDPTLACQFWFSINEHDLSNITFYIAHVLARSCKRLSENDRQRLIKDMEEKLLSFR